MRGSAHWLLKTPHMAVRRSAPVLRALAPSSSSRDADPHLALLSPLSQSPAEHERTKKAVKDFQEHEGPELHHRLKEYAAGRASYIEEWWVRRLAPSLSASLIHK